MSVMPLVAFLPTFGQRSRSRSGCAANILMLRVFLLISEQPCEAWFIYRWDRSEERLLVGDWVLHRHVCEDWRYHAR